MQAILQDAVRSSFVMSVFHTAAWLCLLAVVFMPLEHLFAVHRRRSFSRRLTSDVVFYFISALVPALLLTPIMGAVTWAAHEYGPSSYYQWVAGLPLWLRVIASLAIAEVGFYWGHRWSHEIPFLWRFHQIHHAPTEVYFLISARAHPLDNVFNKLCGFIPVYVLGTITPLTPEGGLISALIVITLVFWGFLIHSNIRFRAGPLEWLIALPAFHLWHHTFEEPRDRNFAPMFPVIDWIFGTLHLPKYHPASYGIDETMPRSVAGQLLHPFDPPGPVQMRRDSQEPRSTA
jgi:sterol desaturase/sphingolipid hydroxylase (fatty acid hydroxylase superfamily)